MEMKITDRLGRFSLSGSEKRKRRALARAWLPRCMVITVMFFRGLKSEVQTGTERPPPAMEKKKGRKRSSRNARQRRRDKRSGVAAAKIAAMPLVSVGPSTIRKNVSPRVSTFRPLRPSDFARGSEWMYRQLSGPAGKSSTRRNVGAPAPPGPSAAPRKLCRQCGEFYTDPSHNPCDGGRVRRR